MKQAIKILQLSDLHLFKDQETKMVGVNPLQSLHEIVNKILNELQQKRPDLIVLTGDISQDFSLVSYETAAKILQKISCPVAATMGNHDYLSPFVEVFGNPTKIITKIASMNNWQILLLNSFLQDKVEGQITDGDLIFLQKSLDANPKQPTVIFLHHQVLPVDSDWLDKIKLLNSAQFLEIIAKYKNVKAVISGHTHQDTSKLYQDIMFLTTPSTSWQFAVKSRGFKLDTLMPGYRWINLYEDGTIQTEVVRIDYNVAFLPDTNSKGY